MMNCGNFSKKVGSVIPGDPASIRLIPMRFQAYKISGGRGVLKNAPSPGPPSPKTFKILVSCFDRRSSASLTDIFKKFLKEGFGEAPSYKAAPQPILISSNAHWYDPMIRPFFSSEITNRATNGKKYVLKVYGFNPKDTIDSRTQRLSVGPCRRGHNH